MLWFTGMFSRVPKAELEQVQAKLTQTQNVLQRFQQCRATLAKERPELAHQYFPYTNDPQLDKPKKTHK